MRIKDLKEFCEGKDPEYDVVLFRWHGDGSSLFHLYPGNPEPVRGEKAYTLSLDNYHPLAPIPRRDYAVIHKDPVYVDTIMHLTAIQYDLVKNILHVYGDGFEIVEFDEDNPTHRAYYGEEE